MRKMFAANTMEKPNEATAVLAWSDSDFDYDSGIEFLSHYVSFCDDDGEPVGTIAKFYSAETAESHGEDMADHFMIDFEMDLCFD